MTPRLKTSIKWTPFPKEFTEQIIETFNDFFADYDLNGQSFRVEGQIYPEEVLLRVGLNHPKRLRQDNLEASMGYNPLDEKALEEIHHMVDFLGHTWEDLLEDEDDAKEFSQEWTACDWNKKKIFFKYSSLNTDLEAEADKLLDQFEKRLVYEDTAEDTPIEESVTSSKINDSENCLH